MTKIKVILSFLLFFLISHFTFATGENFSGSEKLLNTMQNDMSLIDSGLGNLNNRIGNIEQDIVSLKSDQSIELQYKEVYDMSKDIIDTGLVRQTIILGIFTFLMTIIAIGLGIYITRKYNETLGAKNEADNILEKVKDIKQWSFDNSKMIYEQILQQEIEYIFDRLWKYPEDISNFFNRLATNSINDKYFDKFVELYLLAPDKYKFEYLLLIYQHFPSKLLITSEDNIRQEFLNNFENIMQSSYTKEHKDCTEKMVRFLIKNSTGIYRNRFSEYLMNLQNAKYLEKNNHELLKLIVDLFRESDNEQMLQEICSNISIDYNNILDGSTSHA